MKGPPSLEPADFGAFMVEVFDHDPYPYQNRLCERLCTGQEVAALVAPTGLGKTGLVPAWAFALAYQAEAGVERSVPLRLVWTVSRRIIVDAVHDVAVRLAEALRSATPGTVTFEVARRLRALHGHAPGVDALGVTRMRAHVDWPRVWQVRPDAAHIVTATVDQAGSRVLLRGYGVSPGMRPVDAALLACDSLVALDEAHLSQAFATTLRTLREIQAAAPGLGSSNRPPVVMTVTATPPEGTLGHLVTLGPEDLADPRVIARLAPSRPVHFAAGKPGPGDPEAVAERLARAARRLRAAHPEISSLLVWANTVEVARLTYDRLHAHGTGERVELLTGRVRPADAEVLRDEVLPLIAAGRNSSEPITVVTTQTLEVGADVDADAMVTELADSAAITQRCGRVNRTGRLPSAPVVVVDARRADPVYGQVTTRSCRAWVEALAGTTEGLSTRRLAGLVPTVPPAPAPLTSPAPPVLTPERAHDLARTNPPPRPDPPVDLLLHGEAAAQTVAVVWRCDARRVARLLAEAEGGRETSSAVARWLRPVTADEQLELPITTARTWLPEHHDGGSGSATPDLEGGGQPAMEDLAVIAAGEAVVLRGGCAVPPSRLEPGDIVVLPTDVGGCDRYGWAPRSSTDVADLSLGRRQAIRLTPETVLAIFGPAGAGAVEGPLAALDEAEEPVREGDVGEILNLLAAVEIDANPVVGIGPRPAWEHIRGLGLVVRPQSATDGLPEGADCHGSICRSAVGLGEHLEDAGKRAEEIVTHLHLPRHLGRAVALAARLHDLGKADPRQQQIFAGGEVEAGTDVLAKSRSISTSAGAYLASARRAGWPRWARHEHMSILMLAGHPILGDDPHDADLIVHLVGAHHGHGRPLFPPTADPCPPGAKFEFCGEVFAATEGHEHTDWEAPERFGRLLERFGPWGLAWLETLVRSADMSVSAEYDGPGR